MICDAPYIEVDGLSKRFFKRHALAETPPRWVLDHVNLSLVVGTVNALVGESGSGKTTLGRCLLRLTEPTSGTVRVGSHVVFPPSATPWPRRVVLEFRRTNQMIFQNPTDCLNPKRSVRFSLEEPLQIHRVVPRRELRVRCEELLGLVDLDPELLERFPHQISGGQRQRVVIARALATEPSFVVADEPTSALDTSQRSDMVDLLLSLTRRLGLTLLVITHDMALVYRLAQRVFVMFAGRIVESGDTVEVFSNPMHPYTKALLEASRIQPSHQVPRLPTSIPDEPDGGGEHWVGRCAYVGRCPHPRQSCLSASPVMMQPRLARDRLVACHAVGSSIS